MRKIAPISILSISLMYSTSLNAQAINQDIVNGDNYAGMSSGYVILMSGGYVGNFTGGQIATQSGGTVDNISGSGVVNHQSGGVINSVSTGGMINAKSSGITRNLNGGQINTMAGGTLQNLNNGTLGTMYGNQFVIIENIYGGNLNNMYGGVINNVHGGNIGLMTDGVITSMTGGTLNTMQNDAKITTLSGTGTINNLTAGTLQNMDGGNVVALSSTGTISNLTAGTVQNMTGGTVNTLTNTGNISNISDGTVQSMTGGTVNNLSNTGNISNISGGTIQNINGGTVTTMQNNANIDNFLYGVVSNMNGGLIKDIGAGASITQITYGKITGNVNNGVSLTVNNAGYLILDSNTGAESFDREIISNGVVELNKYNYSNATFSLKNNGHLYINETNLDIGTLNIFDDNTEVNFYKPATSDVMTINNFNATHSANFVFNVDYTNALANNLTINNVTGTELNHKVAIGAIIGNGIDHNTPITLIQDNSQLLNFTLANGQYVGLGARNYSLKGEAGSWALYLVPNGLSEAAKIIGVSGSDRVIYSVYNIQNTLHKRLGDVRNFQSKEQLGSWVRTYASDTTVKTLTSSEVISNGIEAGFDKEVSRGCGGRIIAGIGLGLNSSIQSSKAFTTSDGGANSKTPYLGAYATAAWNNGLYVDIIARYAYNNTKAHYHDGANTRIKFNINSNIGMISSEVGYQYKASNKLTLEPRAELIYSYIQSDKFTDTAGFEGKYDETHSILASTGILVRYDLGSIKPYTKLSYLYEFDGETRVEYDNTKFSSDLSGGKYEIGLGLNSNINPNLDIFGEMVYQTGHNSYRSYDANLGLRYKF